MLTEYTPIITQALKHYAWNLAWFGCHFRWLLHLKKSVNAIFINALVGDLADFGCFIFLDLQGLAPPIGSVMLTISIAAILSSF